ncbi:MAG: hypothetical protein ACYDEN_04360 [Acidimicrobiales bacterium]
MTSRTGAADSVGPRAGSGSPRRETGEVSAARRVGSWVVWWTLLMAFWVWVDDSVALPELLAGAAAAAIGATVAELVQHQSGLHFRPRIEWVAPAVGLPARLVRDLAVVLVALWRRVAHGEDPPSRVTVLPVAYGEDTPEGMTRRLLIIGGTSFTPATFALGLDEELGGLVVHQLVARPEAVGR